MRHTLDAARRAAACGLFLILCAAAADAQFRAGVQGTVKDASGAVVPGATVTLTSKETNKSQTTAASDEGFYRFSQLAPGTYSLTAEKSGFKKQVLESVVVNAEEVQGVDLVLTTGDITESVTITETAVPQLDTENANVSKAITTREVRELPQVGRDPYELLRLAPGVFGSGARGSNGNSVGLPNTTGPGGSNSSIFQTENQVPISANGQRLSNNNFLVDGVSVNSLGFGGAAVVTPNQESVKEVRVASSTYSAEDGRNSGAQIKVVSQNGTNDLHGSAFLKYDSPKLNAFNKYGGPGANPSSPNAPPVRVNNFQRQFGGSLGGPLPLPNFGEGNGPMFYSGRNRLFFFVPYEGLRQSNTDTVNAWVETAQYRQLVQTLRPNGVTARVFGASGIQPRIVSVLPAACAPTFNGRPCQAVTGGLDIGSPAGALGQYVNDANAGGGLDGVPDVEFAQIALPNSTRGNQYNTRIDYNRGNDSFALSTYFTRLNSLGSDAGAQGRPIADIAFKPLNSAVTLTYNRVLSATMLNEARFNLTRFADNQLRDTSTTNFGVPRVEVEGLPFDRIRFGARREETTPALFAQNTYEFSDTFNKVRGNQAWKFGGVVRREQDNNSLLGGARPDYSFVGLFNLANDTPVFEAINADPNTGRPADAQRYFRTNYYAAFAQNDWKLRPNLTLNLGLRYEYFSPLTEKRGRLSNITFGSRGLANSRVGVVDRLFKPDRNNFAPRLGFAYSPHRGGFGGLLKQDRVVVRGGFGINYNRIPDVLFSNTRGNPPFFARYNLCCGFPSSPFAGGQILYATGTSNSILSYPANPALAQGIDPATGAPRGGSVEIWGAQEDTPNSYVYAYSLETQIALPFKLTGTVGYQGSAGHKLIRLVNQNFLYPNNPAFFQVFIPQPDVNSNYNALNAELTRRFSRGLQFTANYRFSKSIDQLSYEGPGFVTNQTFPQDNHTERGPSDYDVKHYFVMSTLYDLPFFNRGAGLARKALGGWTVSSILTAHTGFPWTPKTGNCVSTPGGSSLCPARPTGYLGGAGTSQSDSAFITGSNFPGGGLHFFTTAGLPNARPGIGRNSFRGPHYFNIDMSLAKVFGLPDALHLGEGANFEARVNAFNVFNMLNLAPIGFFDPGANINDPNFGRSPRGLAGRVVELQGRFRF
ncbi:MAG: TonB-dependent receptor domain-containing protein [Pyrinomonadaceae bacterium]